MLPDRVSNPGPLTYESGALPIALRGPARVRLFLMYMPYIKFQDSSIRLVHKVVSIQNANVRKRGITQPKIYGIGSEVNQFNYILVCNYMPNIRILALAVFQIFC